MNYSDKKKIYEEEVAILDEKLTSIMYPNFDILYGLQHEVEITSIKNVVQEYEYALFLRIGPDYKDFLDQLDKERRALEPDGLYAIERWERRLEKK